MKTRIFFTFSACLISIIARVRGDDPLTVSIKPANSEVLDVQGSDAFDCTPSGGCKPYTYQWTYPGVTSPPSATGKTPGMLTFGSSAAGNDNDVKVTVTDAKQHTATADVVIKVPKVTLTSGSGSAPNPIKLGITANGHDRKKAFTVNITPTDAVSGLTVAAKDSKIAVTGVTPGTGTIDFNAVGVTASDNPGDTAIQVQITSTSKALNDGSFAVSVVVPSQVGTPHQTFNGVPTITNRVLDAGTSPFISGLNEGYVALVTTYDHQLNITVWDQFQSTIGDTYAGSAVKEDNLNANVTLGTDSTYPDLVGKVAYPPNYVVLATSDAAKNWPTSSPAPIPTSSSTSNINITIDGFELDPGIVNRQTTTSPPNSLNINW